MMMNTRMPLLCGLMLINCWGCSRTDEAALTSVTSEAERANAEAQKVKPELEGLESSNSRQPTANSSSLAKGGLVIYADGTEREFTKIEVVWEEEGGVAVTGQTIPPRERRSDSVELKEWSGANNVFSFNQLASVRFEAVQDSDRQAHHESSLKGIQKGDYSAELQPTYPPFVEVTAIAGAKTRFRYQLGTKSIVVTWADGLGSAAFSDILNEALYKGVEFRMK